MSPSGYSRYTFSSWLIDFCSRFSYAECRSFVNMFYEEEEREVEKIQYKYKLIKQKLRERMFDLKVRF